METRRVSLVDSETGNLVMSIKFARFESNGDWVALVSEQFMNDVGITSMKGLTVRDTNE